MSVYEPVTGRLLLRIRPGDAGGTRAGRVSGKRVLSATPAAILLARSFNNQLKMTPQSPHPPPALLWRQVSNFALVGADGGGTVPRGNGMLVMGQDQMATAVRLPGLRVFNPDAWLSVP